MLKLGANVLLKYAGRGIACRLKAMRSTVVHMPNTCLAANVESRVALLGRAATVLALAILFLTTGTALGAETSVSLSGRWRAAETADEKQERLKAIDEATKHVGVFRRGKARSRLVQRTTPPQSLLIEVDGSKVTIVADDRRLKLELGSHPIEVSGSEGKERLELAQRWTEHGYG